MDFESNHGIQTIIDQYVNNSFLLDNFFFNKIFNKIYLMFINQCLLTNFFRTIISWTYFKKLFITFLYFNKNRSMSTLFFFPQIFYKICLTGNFNGL